MRLKNSVISLAMCLLVAISFIKVDVFAADNEWHVGDIIDGSQLTNDVESVGTYQNLARGTFLSNGSCQITNNGNGTVYVSGQTYCYRTADTVKVTVYVQRLSGDDWYTVSQRTYTNNNAYSVVGEYNVAVTPGYFYRVVGYHSATKGGIVETENSQTSGIWVG